MLSYILYILGIIVAFVAVICSIVVNTKFNKWAKENSLRGMTGAQVAEWMLRQVGIHDVAICKLEKGNALNNYYHPKHRTVNLSSEVYESSSIAAIAVAAHECGHAIQHHEQYAPLTLRSALAPVASLGTNVAPLLFFIGLIVIYLFETTAFVWLIDLAILAYALAVIFYFVTLPVEFNASSRALKALENSNILNGNELHGAQQVLSAAAMTYVAAAAAAAIQLLRMLVVRGRE